ncbi:uncharacterized protein K452DRAFT_351784 [Aplosporella prunicola CBS 121167]|uniref:F-box domain-containing protein n=1 Tax=Aplosporella prunicola CBS 121167 TaxID=1176127 RepID=A0A6A6BBB0_9PEZI|nr:uncharacterized protein K452DRAFT_351784 [Aplosporella prunicola CBS 121167]KAF2140525.1 hypothetical protein K452DRAFT_351784 [Aplosporella prunicola CBS 121167]
MSLTLDRLPFDVLFAIASYVSLEDVIHLGLVCRQLRQLFLYENTLCRRTIENHARFTQEAQRAAQGQLSYREALRSVYSRRKAFASAKPNSACVIGYGSSFIYRQGVVCYMSQGLMLVRSLHGSTTHKAIDISSVRATLFGPGSPQADFQPEVSLLHYSDDFVSMHYDYTDYLDHSFLIVIDLLRWNPATAQGLIKRQLSSANKLFVRNTSAYLYYGTHTGTGTHGHHEWKIRGMRLREDHYMPPNIPALQLDEFVGSDVGSTVAFEIHNGFFYAVSNQTSFDVEEVDWTSFYHCIRFPLNNPVKEACEIKKDVYRRQHKEGPINDSWTDLSLQVDEATNSLRIIEARREWLDGGSKQLRTFYTHESVPLLPLLPLDDPLARTIGSGNNPHYAPERPRLYRHTHPEHSHSDNTRIFPEFILSKTKFKAYNHSCGAFLDLVEDANCCSGAGLGTPCLRLRIGSRRPEPVEPVPIEEKRKAKGKATTGCSSSSPENFMLHNPSNASPLPSASLDPRDRFMYSPIRLWPPPCAAPQLKAPDCASLLHRILNAPLPATTTSSKASAYAPPAATEIPRYGDGEGPICLVSFDAGINAEKLAGRMDRNGAEDMVFSGIMGQSPMRKDSAVSGCGESPPDGPVLVWKG